MDKSEAPSQESTEYAASWCARMRDNAPDGETAYHYHQLEQMWRERG